MGAAGRRAPRWLKLGAGALVAVAFGWGAVLRAGGAVAAEPAAAAAAPAEVETAAEALLFETDHLAGVQGATRLEYKFSWDGAHPFVDRIVLSVGAGPVRSVAPDYLSGDHHVDFPAIADAHGNPLLLYFLEHDLREMQRATQGHADYFRRVIRRAMARADLKIDTLQVQVDGRSVQASRVVIAPFRGDANVASHYPALLEKTYEFVLSPEVPGQIVSLATRTPSAEGKELTARIQWERSSPL